MWRATARGLAPTAVNAALSSGCRAWRSYEPMQLPLRDRVVDATYMTEIEYQDRCVPIPPPARCAKR